MPCGDEVLATALLGCLLHHCEVVSLTACQVYLTGAAERSAEDIAAAQGEVAQPSGPHH